MTQKIYLLFCFITTIALQNSYGQSAVPKKFHSKDFNWTITIPDNFETVSKSDWTKIQNRGQQAIEDTFDQEIDNQSVNIFVFKNDQFNYFEACHQPFDPKIDGNYVQSCKDVNNLLYKVMQEQLPGSPIDTLRTVEKIDNLEFQVFKIAQTLPNQKTFTMIMYNRLFGKKELAVNIMYMDEAKGKQMLSSWRNSTFLKKVPKAAIKNKK
ncbi:hypothetical protein [Flavobacterium cerinum]|uniref:DUF1795 domain-containing protein n=1 Tax=Flavobacterium cerinum TaxID=2502784 RepID=A0ABY5ISM9_9FLAO|nr:hypothetical protein [Flavobacterium cerinum]UUC45311.1 hypothetical protein NOX80_16995 [Flavobacterium cerinum]